MLLAERPLCHHMLLTRHPACIVLKRRYVIRTGDGRSPDLRVEASPNLPGCIVQWSMSGWLSAHSCGGSHGFGAYKATPHRVPFSSHQRFGVREPSMTNDRKVS
jgi:hypothetical protein